MPFLHFKESVASLVPLAAKMLSAASIFDLTLSLSLGPEGMGEIGRNMC